MKKTNMTDKMIATMEDVLGFDNSNGLYTIEVPATDSITMFCPLNIDNKKICAYNEQGLERYKNNKKDCDLFDPIGNDTHLEMLKDALKKFNENLFIVNVKEDGLWYGKIFLETDILKNDDDEEVPLDNELFLETTKGYKKRNEAITKVILMNWGYVEE